MSATVTLSWNAGGGSNSTGQKVQYRLDNTAPNGAWTDGSAVDTVSNTAYGTNPFPASVTSVKISGLQDNVLYDFRVLNFCSDGGPTASAPITKIKITCPSVTYTLQSTSIAFSFAHLGGNVSKYYVELLSSTDFALQNMTITTLDPTISGTFSGLSPSTTYKVRITVFAGAAFGYSNTCASDTKSTAAPSPCNAPTNVQATMA